MDQPWGEVELSLLAAGVGSEIPSRTKKYGFHSGHSIPHTVSILCLSL